MSVSRKRLHDTELFVGSFRILKHRQQTVCAHLHVVLSRLVEVDSRDVLRTATLERFLFWIWIIHFRGLVSWWFAVVISAPSRLDGMHIASLALVDCFIWWLFSLNFISFIMTPTLARFYPLFIIWIQRLLLIYSHIVHGLVIFVIGSIVQSVRRFCNDGISATHLAAAITIGLPIPRSLRPLNIFYFQLWLITLRRWYTWTTLLTVKIIRISTIVLPTHLGRLPHRNCVIRLDWTFAAVVDGLLQVLWLSNFILSSLILLLDNRCWIWWHQAIIFSSCRDSRTRGCLLNLWHLSCRRWINFESVRTMIQVHRWTIILLQHWFIYRILWNYLAILKNRIVAILPI